MAVQESTVINANVEQVIEAFSSEDFARFVCSEVGVEFGSFSVSGDTSAEFTATTERTVPAERVPDIARKFVGNKSGGLRLALPSPDLVKTCEIPACYFSFIKDRAVLVQDGQLVVVHKGSC